MHIIMKEKASFGATDRVSLTDNAVLCITIRQEIASTLCPRKNSRNTHERIGSSCNIEVKTNPAEAAVQLNSSTSQGRSNAMETLTNVITQTRVRDGFHAAEAMHGFLCICSKLKNKINKLLVGAG
jgi:hypothetical protein